MDIRGPAGTRADERSWLWIEIAENARSFSSELSGKASVEAAVQHVIAVNVEEQVIGDEYS